MRIMDNITIRWLGVAGIEIGCAGRRIVFDPYFTRIPFHKLWLGRVAPDAALVHKHLPECDAVFISHSHVDHLLDVPEVIRQTRADAFGSPNTCRLLHACGAPEEKIHEIRLGYFLEIGPFKINAYAQRPHVSVGGYGMRPLRSTLIPPLRAGDYRMDFGMSFLVEVQGVRLLVEACLDLDAVGRVDALFTVPFWGVAGSERVHYQRLLDAYRPRVIIPIHWDDMWIPLSQPIRGQWVTTGRIFPPIARLDRDRFKRTIELIDPKAHVLLPERLETYSWLEMQ